MYASLSEWARLQEYKGGRRFHAWVGPIGGKEERGRRKNRRKKRAELGGSSREKRVMHHEQCIYGSPRAVMGSDLPHAWAGITTRLGAGLILLFIYFSFL